MGSSILDKLTNDIKIAMKSKDSVRLLTLRTIHSEIKNVGIDKRKEITDDDVASVLAKGIKQRLDAFEQFTKAGRTDLAENEQKQIEIYQEYQPKQLTRDEIISIVDSVIAETGATGKKDMGLVMKNLMVHVKGKADGKIVSEIVSGKLP